jgi:hypothetical protein
MGPLARMKARSSAVVVATAAILSLGLLIVPAATAATDSTDSTVDGIGGTELSLSAATPAALTLTHSLAGTSTSLVTVTSTSPSWTLSIEDADASGSGTPGFMDKVNCVGGALLGGSLSSALEWSSDGSTFNALSATPATVATGSLIDAKTVTYRQSLGASDAVAAGDCYSLTTTYTVTG